MEDKIKAAITAYLEENTCAALGKKDWFLQFNKPIEKMFLSKLAEEITQCITPLLAPPAPDWEDAPPWANYQTTDDDGMRVYWATKPYANIEDGTWTHRDARAEFKEVKYKYPDWKNSLKQRPG